MKNTKNLYPDAITKAIEDFKVRFAKMLMAVELIQIKYKKMHKMHLFYILLYYYILFNFSKDLFTSLLTLFIFLFIYSLYALLQPLIKKFSQDVGLYISNK